MDKMCLGWAVCWRSCGLINGQWHIHKPSCPRASQSLSVPALGTAAQHPPLQWDVLSPGQCREPEGPVSVAPVSDIITTSHQGKASGRRGRDSVLTCRPQQQEGPRKRSYIRALWRAWPALWGSGLSSEHCCGQAGRTGRAYPPLRHPRMPGRLKGGWPPVEPHLARGSSSSGGSAGVRICLHNSSHSRDWPQRGPCHAPPGHDTASGGHTGGR